MKVTKRMILAVGIMQLMRNSQVVSHIMIRLTSIILIIQQKLMEYLA